MKIEQIKASKLKPATYNPRQISTKQYKDLSKSIATFGLVDPIIVNKDFTVIGGHQRLKVLNEMQTDTIPCVVLDLSKEKERELNVRLNKNTGDFDIDILANEFDIDELVDWGFKHIDLGLNIDKIEEGNIEDDHIPEVKESRVKLGDVWQLGKHRLMCGDSTKESDVEKLMNGDKADLVFTDPPYNVNKKILNDNLQNEQYINLISQMLNNAKKHIIENATIMVWCCEKELFNIKPILDTYAIFRRLLIWVYTKGIALNNNYSKQSEFLLYYTINKKKFIFNDMQIRVKSQRMLNNDKRAGKDGKVPPNWFDDNRISGNFKERQNHPTQKPLSICKRFVIAHSNKIVLDVFLGSGTTLIACEKTNRICYGMELDTKYCDVIIERWEQFTGQKATKL